MNPLQKLIQRHSKWAADDLRASLQRHSFLLLMSVAALNERLGKKRAKDLTEAMQLRKVKKK